MPFLTRVPQVIQRTCALCVSITLFGFATLRPTAQQPHKEYPAYEEGLALWRSPGKDNNSCSFCHSVEGLEIAEYAFDDATIKRRAEPHFGAAGAEKIVAFIHAVRHKYRITKLLDPLQDRPLQPAGKVLPGDTPEERDNAFGREIAARLPTLANGRIDSLAKAIEAKNEVQQLDPRHLRVGILFNRISEDSFHGKEHATLAHWIADETVVLKFPWDVYFDRADDYLANPNLANLRPLVAIIALTNRDFYGQLMSMDKYKALQILQHIERLRSQGVDFFAGKGPVALAEWPGTALQNPFLELGVLADDRSATPFEQFVFPEAVLRKKSGGPSHDEQLKAMRLPFLWLGWLFDEGLQRSGNCPEERVTRIMTERLLSDGPYPFHDAFFITKKLVTDSFEPQAWNRTEPQRLVIDYSEFLPNASKYEPSDAESRALYRRFVANSFRMSLFLVQDGLKKGQLSAREFSPEQILKMGDYIKHVDPDGAAGAEVIAKDLLR